MVFYWTLAIVILIMGFLSEFTKDKLFKKVLIFSIFFLMFVISAFRVNIGVDYSGHYSIYKVANSSNPKLVLSEPLFYLLCIVCNQIGVGYYGVVFSISFLTLYPLYYISRKEKTSIILILYFFLTYLISYALMRQLCALSLSMLGTYFYINKEYKKKGLLLLISAGLMHSSLWAYLVIFLLGKVIKLNLRTTIIISIFLIIFSKYIDIISILKKIFINTKYGYYFLRESLNKKTEMGTGLGSIIRFIIYFIELYFLVTVRENNNYRFNLCFIFLIICDLVSLKMVILLRLRFVFLGVLYYPFIYKNDFFKYKKHFYLISTWFFIFIILFYILTFSSTAEWGNIPYQSVFFTPMLDL